ncbi:MAG: NAD-dependent epimerase/dehydratase family protein [Rhodoglobus sp.]|nr:NAD-dependent epimerase/dehydratase family protein [Rhodoglobus sp.]
MTILVTGGTGTLGRPTVARLTAHGHDVRILSRKPGRNRFIGDVTTGVGLREALAHVDTVLHLATSAGSKDPAQARIVVDACRDAGVKHLVFISIVGVDDIPYPYYRAKLESERIIEQSGIPYTILRATQFHSFVGMFIKLQRNLPVVLALDVPDQPIAVEEVAARLVELVNAGPSGHATDIGGPEQLRLREAIHIWQRAHGTSKPVWMLHLFGKTIRAFQEGHHMTPMPGYGTERFAQYAEREAAGNRAPADRGRGTNEA